ncbi:conserved exported hypothetical protein [Cupriavidus taiwanensis]|uniref:Uncharacterized protein n=1 Tax=Cupriavidus taiwanensis TaxID=164546 RepID=A0A976B2G8_9BURK|nr:conserved exported hypothetical protein [Cupriavidus taiwanensis]SOZ30171.1 conserved exported hypothetical protein [Cupriavidus taiwanensis]SOZ47092.1 conserved exported hypothetical protein [Cupriavidus taiwanensis]SOZ68033.1 conserved exported hypothetical protein [Cupriavidus taiwanensis]SOZ68942.1 conserved exported hypothetical protein [Cupriavidus taiwanensis]
MPVARAMARWKAKSLSTASLPSPAPCLSSSSAWRIAASCASVRRAAARPAASASTLTRNSSIAITSMAVPSASGPIRNGDGASAARSSTKVPIPWRVSTRPLACSRDSASRTTVRLTPMVAMISDSVGSLSPGLSWPWRISSPRACTTSSASVRPRRRNGVGAELGVGARGWAFGMAATYEYRETAGIRAGFPGLDRPETASLYWVISHTMTDNIRNTKAGVKDRTPAAMPETVPK